MQDLILVRQNAFIEISTGDSDITVLPVSVELEFRSAFRDGIRTLFGQSQEFAGEWHDVRAHVGEC